MFSVISVWSRDTKHSLPREAGWGVVTITFLARVIVKVSSSVQLPPKLWLCIHLWPSFVWVDQFSRWTIYKSPISQYIIRVHLNGQYQILDNGMPCMKLYIIFNQPPPTTFNGLPLSYELTFFCLNAKSKLYRVDGLMQTWRLIMRYTKWCPLVAAINTLLFTDHCLLEVWVGIWIDKVSCHYWRSSACK